MKSFWKDFEDPDPRIYHPSKILNYAGDNDPLHDLYLSLPYAESPSPLMIFFHGGGLTTSKRECPDGIFNGVFAVAEPRYRISPASKAPAAIEDAAQAIAWCFDNAEKYNIDRTRIFVGGMSAGAYLAAISVMAPEWLAAYGLNFKDIAGLALISGQMSTHFRVKSDLGRDNGAYNPLFDEYAPLSHLSAELPPMLFITGESGLDMPGRPEENAFTAASLRAIGHKFIRYYSLAGHAHVPSFLSCDHLLMQFLDQVLFSIDQKQK